MGEINAADLRTLMRELNMEALDQLDPNDFVGFGMKNSSVYRALFVRMVKAANLSPEEGAVVVALATAVKSKKRNLEAMEIFSEAGWFKKVKAFFRDRTVQYTAQETPALFGVVHIPFVAARAWVRFTLPVNRTVEFFLKNLWAAQMHLSPELMAEQWVWEFNFWTNVVRKGSNKYEQHTIFLPLWGNQIEKVGAMQQDFPRTVTLRMCNLGHYGPKRLVTKKANTARTEGREKK